MTSSRRTSQSRRWRNVALYAALIGTIALSGASVARATTITVDSLSDDTNAGHCTLREAINSANQAGSTGSCDLGTSTDTIQFNVTGTINLVDTLPAITSGTTLTITGPTTSSSGIIIDGNSSVQILRVSSGGTLTLQYLTLQNGSVTGASGPSGGDGDGGAVQNQGTLTTNNCTLSNNHATGGEGTSGQGGSGRGGGIFNAGTLSISGSTLASNETIGGKTDPDPPYPGSGLGGAIYASSGTMTVITNTTLSQNSASSAGGAVNVLGGTVTITNATFVANSAGCCVHMPNFGNAILNDGVVNVRGTIFGGNGQGACAGTVVNDVGYNIAAQYTSYPSGTYPECYLASPTSQSLPLAQIGLSSGLADNGGPTQTIALGPGGGANTFIPAASCTDQSPTPHQLTTDQRGFPRPAASHSGFCSAGAFEYGDSAPTSTPTGTPTATPTPTPPTVPAVVHVSKTSVNFGRVKIGKSKTSVVKLTNTSKKGGATVSFSGATFTRSSSDFSVSTTCLRAVPPKKQCTVTLGFAPTAVGPESATVTVYSDASNSPQAIGVTGTGK